MEKENWSYEVLIGGKTAAKFELFSPFGARARAVINAIIGDVEIVNELTLGDGSLQLETSDGGFIEIKVL